MELYDRAHDAQVAFRLEANRVLADLRRTAAPVVGKLTSARRANAIKVKRDKVLKELKGKLTGLTKEVLEATPSNCMAMANCLSDDLRSIKEMLGLMETALSDQEAINVDIGALIAPVELELDKYMKSCKKLHTEADDEARRAGISHPATVTSTGGGGPSQSLGLEQIECPSFSGKLADYSMFKESWKHLVHRNLDDCQS